MSFPAPFVSAAQTVKTEWVDYNGHFNMAYYNVLFDTASEEMFAQFGLGPNYVRQANCSYFTLEAHLTYLRELHAGDVVLIENQLLDFDQKRVHYVQCMKHKTEGWVACVSEVIVSHVDLLEKRTSFFPPEVQKHIENVFALHKDLPRPKQVGHKIEIPRQM
jgi:acyl-CoA thioester hydrolase